MLAQSIPMCRLAAAVLAALGSVDHALAGELLTIAGNGTGSYFSVMDAYAAAADGDTLLVTDAPMDSTLTFSGKGVTFINADPGTWQPFDVSVENLPSTSRVVLRNIHHGPNQDWSAIRIRDCDGAVIIADSDLNAVGASNSRSVAISRCAIEFKGIPSPFFTGGVSAVTVVDSSVMITSCSMKGGYGGDGTCGSGICTSCCTEGGFGGSGLAIGGASHVRVQASTLEPGAGGSGGCSCSNGLDGYGYVTPSTSRLILLSSTVIGGSAGTGQAIVIGDTLRTMEHPTSVAAGGTFTLLTRGEPGEQAFLLAGGTFVFQISSVTAGPLQVNQTPGRRFLGVVPSSGTLAVQLMAPNVPASEVVGSALQVAFWNPNGSVRFAPADIIDFQGAGVTGW